MPENKTITIDAYQASLFHFALTAGIELRTAQIKLKGAQPFAEAIALQISAFKAERDKLAAAFPNLVQGATDGGAA